MEDCSERPVVHEEAMLTSARNVADLVRASAQRGPSHVAVVDVASGVSLTWETIDGAIDAFARRLADSGLEPGDRVAVRLPTSPEFVVAVFGILRAGGVVVP
ncbi:MAG TPA: AMP-binding protein, partial [Lentzea sp.]